MASELAKAYVQILPTAEGISGSISKLLDGEAESAGKSAGERISSAMGTALKTGGAIVAGAGAAIAGLTKELISGASETAAYGDNIDKMSQKMGLSIQAYQEWDAIMQHSGTSIESLQSGMKTLANAVENGNGAFERLGISQEEIASMDNEQLFSATITALQNVDNETERTYLAGQLLGRGATELGALLNTSAEDTEAMRQRVHELGGVMSDEAVKAAAAYQDSLQDMQTAFKGLSRGLLEEFMPDITQIMDGLTEIFSGDSEKGIEMVSTGVDMVIDDITGKLPQFLDLGLKILSSIVQALIDNLPKLLEAGGELVGELIAGLIKTIPQLIAMAPDLVVAIITGLINAWPEIKAAGADLIGQIIDGLTSLFSSLTQAGRDTVEKVKAGFMEKIEQAKTWGRDLIQNFISGIREKWDALKSTVSQTAQSIKAYLGFSEPDMGPLADFHTYAPDMMDLFAKGIRDNISTVTSAAREAAAATRDGMTSAPVDPVTQMQPNAGGGDVVAALLSCTARIVAAIESSGGAVDYNALAGRLWAPMQQQDNIHGGSLVAFTR